MLLFVKAKSMHGKTMNLMAFWLNLTLKLHLIHVLEYHDRFLALPTRNDCLAVVTWEVGLTLNLRNCLPMCGSDPESFYPRAYDLYDPLECGPLDDTDDKCHSVFLNWIMETLGEKTHESSICRCLVGKLGMVDIFTSWLHMFDISPRRADFALNFKFTKALGILKSWRGGILKRKLPMRVPPFHEAQAILREFLRNIDSQAVLSSIRSRPAMVLHGGLFSASVLPLEGLPSWQCDGGCWCSQNLRTMRSYTTCCCLEKYSNLKLQSSIQKELLKEIQISIENANLYSIS